MKIIIKTPRGRVIDTFVLTNPNIIEVCETLRKHYKGCHVHILYEEV